MSPDQLRDAGSDIGRPPEPGDDRPPQPNLRPILIIAGALAAVLILDRYLYLNAIVQLLLLAVVATTAINLWNRRYGIAALVIGGAALPVVIGAVIFMMEDCDGYEPCGYAVAWGALAAVGIALLVVTLPTLIAGIVIAVRDTRNAAEPDP